MGTRGYRIIKFRGRYWIFYNHWDSYPDALGQWLVDSIPADPEQYQKWLQSQRHLFAKWDSLLNELLTIQPEDMRKLLSGEPHKAVFYAAFDERLPTNAPPGYTSSVKDDDSWIEWTYTIDLDREVFTVDDGAHFTLNKIPGTWMEALSQDRRFLLPQLVPAESVATLALDPPRLTTSTDHNNLQPRLVKPKNPDQSLPTYLTGIKLRWMLFDMIQKSLLNDLSVSLLSWHARDLPFREFAFYILCLASGGDHLALLDERYAKMPYTEALYFGIPTEDSSGTDIELATYLGIGYHMAGLPIGFAPEETKYWFEGALICLVPRLDCPGIFEQAIVDAVDYGRAQCTRSSFNAVLISIEHLVLIKSFPDGTVDHTEVLPLIHIISHRSKDPYARYGDQALDTFYSAYYGIEKQKVRLVTPIFVRDVSIRDTFMALVQFFNTTTLETLRPTRPNEARLPDEICEMILYNVSDAKTYNACLKVSRRFRLICQQRPLVMDNIVFQDPLPKDQALSSIQEKGNVEVRSNPQTPPDFLAVEVSSGRQMDVWLRSENEFSNAPTCFAVAGHEWNRKTVVNQRISFEGLSIPLASVDDAGERDTCTSV